MAVFREQRKKKLAGPGDVSITFQIFDALLKNCRENIMSLSKLIRIHPPNTVINQTQENTHY